LKKGFRVYNFGVRKLEKPPTIDPRVGLPELAIYNIVQIFPHGGVFMLSEEVMFNEPLQAWNVYRLAQKKIKNGIVGGGGRNWRIALPPGVLPRLMKMIMEKMDEGIEDEKTIES
jgi:hypothetical protein